MGLNLSTIVCFVVNQHCSDEDSTTRPLYLVTASVDKMVLKKPISVDIDLKMVGAVIWVGHSSIEIQLDVIQPSNGTFLELNSSIDISTIIRC